MWIKGGSHTDYILVEEEDIKTENQQKELMENWGENSDGGHNYGYRVDMEILEGNEIPPKEWIEKEIRNTKFSLSALRRNIEKQKEILKIYKGLLS